MTNAFLPPLVPPPTSPAFEQGSLPGDGTARDTVQASRPDAPTSKTEEKARISGGRPGSDASRSRRAYVFVQAHWRDDAADAASSAGIGGGRPALSRRPSPDPLNGELQTRLTYPTRKGAGELGTLPMRKPASALSRSLITSAPVHRDERHSHC